MTSNFDHKHVEQRLRKEIIKNHDDATDETLLTLCAVWAQSATLELIDYLVDKNGDGFQENYGKALARSRSLVDSLGRNSYRIISKQSCYDALRPIIRFVVSFVDSSLVEPEHRDKFDVHPTEGLAPGIPLLKEIMPLVCFVWKRRETLHKISWLAGPDDDAAGRPASPEELERAFDVCRAKVDSMASDSFMDRVRNNTLAKYMPRWTLSVPAVRPFLLTHDFYQAMRESDPIGLNKAYRDSSTPPLLVFKKGEGVTAQRETMLAMILCARNIDITDERCGKIVQLPVSRSTLVFVAGQYTFATPETKKLAHGFGSGECGLLGALLPLLTKTDPLSCKFILGDSNFFKPQSEDADFTSSKCF